MRKFYILLFISVWFSGCFAQKNNDSSKLLGSWTYVETRDENGKKIEADDNQRILMNEPNLVYESNFTYRMVFTSEHVDTGKWKFNQKNMIIEHYLFIDSTDFIGKDLIKQGLAKKQKDGKYYEKEDSKIIKLSDNEMILQDIGIQVVYKKD